MGVMVVMGGCEGWGEGFFFRGIEKNATFVRESSAWMDAARKQRIENQEKAMGSAKWIAGLLGWAAWGPIGALIGFAVGSVVDRIGSIKIYSQDDADAAENSGRGGYTRGGYTRTGTAGGGSSRGRYTNAEQRNSFFMSLLVLSSAVIRADGQVRQIELNYVRQFIRSNFGAQLEDEAMRVLDGLNRQSVDIYSVGAQIAANMNYSQRLQLFHYLAGIANADGDFTVSERDVLQVIASAIQISNSDAASVLAMYYKEKESAYEVLEISPSATDDEVKSAYRRMAMKHHPDKVATLGPEVQKAAAEKFRKIQEAYETIKQERGIS